MKKIYKTVIDIIFVGMIVLFLVLGLVCTLFFPEDINYLENRSANKVEKLTAESYLSGEFQKKFSDALNDQVLLQGRMKKLYNNFNSYFEKSMLSYAMKNGAEQRYVSIKDGLLYCDNLVYYPRDLDSMKENLDKKIENIEKIANEFPNIEFDIYYIEKDTDINFETNEKVGAYEYLSKRIKRDNIRMDALKIDNFDDFESEFYKTDHHWNCYGSYQGYCDIMNLLNKSDEIIKPTKKLVLKKYKLSGSKAAAIGANDVFVEEFPVFQFQFPKMDIFIDGVGVKDYGNQQGYIQGEASKEGFTYGAFYGGDNGEIIFDTHKIEKENILIIGESYDNAILKLLASSFNKTYSIDLRNYERTFGTQFRFSEYVKENQIDKVLLIGNVDYFVMDEFMLED